MMMTRRQACGAAALGAALCVRVPRLWAAPYDLLITGGRVIDPSLGLDATRDVAIANGRIVAVEPTITAEAAETLDARGKLVVPGLLDIHTHAARGKEEPPLCLADGVTGFVDAGSAGADRIADVVAVAQAAPNLGRVLLNIARTGVIAGGELMDLSRAAPSGCAQRRRRQGAAGDGFPRRAAAQVASCMCRPAPSSPRRAQAQHARGRHRAGHRPGELVRLTRGRVGHHGEGHRPLGMACIPRLLVDARV